MDELTIDGKTYVSSKRAAAITGYAKDYVGQLCREGRVEARLVGRSWYVYEPSITKHRFAELGEEEVEVKDPEKTAEEVLERSENTNIQAVWEPSVYKDDSGKHLPEVSKEELNQSVVTDMQNAWHTWFSRDIAPVEPQEEAVQTEPVEISAQEEVVAPIDSITDVQEEEIATPELAYVRTRAHEEEEIVPIRRMEAPRAYDMVPKEYVRSYAAPVSKAATPRRKVTIIGGRSYTVVKALLIGLMIISISIALMGTGLGESFTGTGMDEIFVIKFFEGINDININ